MGCGAQPTAQLYKQYDL